MNAPITIDSRPQDPEREERGDFIQSFAVDGDAAFHAPMIRSACVISTWLIRILLFFLDSSARQLDLQTQKFKTVENQPLRLCT